MDVSEYENIFSRLYKPSAKIPEMIAIPPMRFAMIDGSGDPNTSKDFEDAVSALYGISYGIKFLPKKNAAPAGYFEYRVSALEGLWDMPQGVDYTLKNKDKFLWTLMIMQPAFVTKEIFEEVRVEQKKNKGIDALEQVRFETYDEGLCCQMLHKGSYDSEAATFETMQKFAGEQGFKRTAMSHHEIYMSDARRTKPENLKTILRFRVRKNG